MRYHYSIDQWVSGPGHPWVVRYPQNRFLTDKGTWEFVPEGMAIPIACQFKSALKAALAVVEKLASK